MHRRKSGNCNKPLRRESRNRGENRSRTRQPEESSRPARPKHLKGAAIGLWYKEQSKLKEAENVVEVYLDAEKKDIIENVLLQAGRAEMQEKGDQNQESRPFRSFSSKVNVSFKNRIQQMIHKPCENDEVLDEQLLKNLKSKEESRNYQNMKSFRENLPSYKMRDQLVNLINENQIVVISGETGCGKTTQVVQFVLDDYIRKSKGSLCNIICSQPRRISVVTVAERVAAERDEEIGESVGYQIRLENIWPKRSRGCITFVTTGILLQMLESNPILSQTSHLFLDEIHERNYQSDLMMALLKYIIPKRPDLKVVLMSATINASSFSKYFGDAPCIDIPGYTYPVEEIYLEQILELTNYEFPCRNEPVLPFRRGKKQLDPLFTDYILPYVRQLSTTGLYKKSVINQLMNPLSEEIDISLIATTVEYISRNEPEGAILVFVPGLTEIRTLHKELMNSRYFSSSLFLIIPMHSIMPTIRQKEAFLRPPKGVRKIIIATSILETSITIDDIVYVIDTGRQKFPGFDIKHNVATLNPVWETYANAKQRRGRAGRIQSGKCYKLFTKAREDVFEQYPVPEIQSIRLEQVILKTKTLQLEVTPFLEQLMDPPDPDTVKLSLRVLRTLNAIDAEERLTPLGYHLTRLPMDPNVGKMLLMAAIFSCVDPIFSIVACLSFKCPFVMPLGKEEEVIRMKKHLSQGEKSDHFIYSEALKRWEEACEAGNGPAFAYDHYLSRHTLSLLCDMKMQFAKSLHEMNFLSNSDPKDPESNVNSHNRSLIKAIVCAGLYPNVAMIRRMNSGKDSVLMKTVEHRSVRFHKKSYCWHLEKFESPFFVYNTMLRSSEIYLHDATMIYPMPLLFFGERVDIVEVPQGYNIRVDDMIKFKCLKKTGLLVKKLRNQLDWILESAIEYPGRIDWRVTDKKTLILSAIVELITSERDVPDFGISSVKGRENSGRGRPTK